MGFSGDLSCIRRERLTVGPKLRVYVVLLGRGYRERKRWNAQIIDAWFLHPSLIAALEFTRIDPTWTLHDAAHLFRGEPGSRRLLLLHI